MLEKTEKLINTCQRQPKSLSKYTLEKPECRDTVNIKQQTQNKAKYTEQKNIRPATRNPNKPMLVVYGYSSVII